MDPFESDANVLRARLIACGWQCVTAPLAPVERWRSPDGIVRALPEAWDRARRDATGAARDADWIERPPGFEVVESVHGANVAAGGRGREVGMSAMIPTPPELRWRDATIEEKQDLAAGLAVCGISIPQFADMCGVTDDVAEAWVDIRRANQVPAALERFPRVPRALIEFLRTARDRRRGEHYLGATTPEEQQAVVMLRMGQTITAIAPTVSVERLGREVAAQHLTVGEALHNALGAWLSQLRRRIVTRPHIAARKGDA